MQAALEKLALADPELANRVRMDPGTRQLSAETLGFLVEESIWGLSQELNLGRAMGMGFLRLGGREDAAAMRRYATFVRHCARQGPALARIVADLLPSVLKTDDPQMLDLFLKTLEVAGGQGTHTLNDYLKPAAGLLDTGDHAAAQSYLQMLMMVLPQPLSYHQNLNLSQMLPATCLAMEGSKRAWQIRELSRVASAEVRWVEAFTRGLEKGLRLLAAEDLALYVDTGLDRCQGAVGRGIRFFSLSTQLGRELFDRLLTVVFLFQVSRQLNRYLSARTGRVITVRPISSLLPALQSEGGSVVSDAHHVYLPDELSLPTRAENRQLYKALASLEAGCHEFGTFEFDLERTLERCGGAARCDAAGDEGSDLERFLERFDHVSLAADLFVIFEHGRIRRHLEAAYPGLIGRYLPLFQQEAACIASGESRFHALSFLYRRLALAMAETLPAEGLSRQQAACLGSVISEFEERLHPGVPVEVSAVLVSLVYASLAENFPMDRDSRPLTFPFGRRLALQLVGAVDKVWERLAVALQRRLLKKGFKVYRVDVRRALAAANGVLSSAELADLVRRRQADVQVDPVALERVLNDVGVTAQVPEVQGRIFWYREWDVCSADYLMRHARVAEQVASGTNEDFYHGVLTRYAGMLGHLRRSFELLRPEGLKLLRRWREGDSFDYRALLEYAVDRRMGIMPSQRIYIKRLKQLRDVAVLLLVDLSRSTANLLPGGSTSVLDVEKEAIVLLCEALQKSGDRFAVAAFFSMTRFAVTYFCVKDFDEGVNAGVKGRMGALEARGRTRMGAAVRHAAARLKDVAARVRLLVMLSDGFPNDSDYKGEYAIADAARAVSETRARGIYVHGITVNLSDAARLDDIYGCGRHSLISDVRELPRKLPGIYRHLTR